MKAFVLKIGLFLCLLCLVDVVFILFRYRDVNVFSKISFQKLHTLSKYLKADKTDSVDVGIFGASHGQFGVSPEIIAQQTGLSALNFAYGGGSNLGAQYEYINKLDVKMKVMVYTLSVFSLNEAPVTTNEFQASFFNEGLKQNAALDEGKSLINEVMTHSNIYLYGHFLFRYVGDMANGKFRLPYFRKVNSDTDLSMFSSYRGYDISPRGWVKGHGTLERSFVRYAHLYFNPHQGAAEKLQDIAEYCKANGTQLFIVQVPEHSVALRASQKYDAFDKWIKKFAAENGVTYLNFNTPAVFPTGVDSLFFDSDHLSKPGAVLFSNQLAKELRARVSP